MEAEFSESFGVHYHHITWKIPGFFSLRSSQKRDFTFRNVNWHLQVHIAFGNVHLSIWPYYGNPDSDLYWNFGIKVNMDEHYSYGGILNKENNYNLARCLIKGSKLLNERDSLAPNGTLTIFSRLRLASEETASVDASSQTDPFETTLFDAEMQVSAASSKSFGNLSLDFQELLQSGKHSDVLLKVAGREFKAHQAILAARSPVFSAMMDHEMKEKLTGIVEIQDVDPDTFQEFLHFLYTGSIRTVTADKAPSLYAIADKYQTDDLKKVCVKYLLNNNISVDNFIDVLELSLRHHEETLTNVATDFFVKHAEEIVATAKWQAFLAENLILGNELFLKALRSQRQ